MAFLLPRPHARAGFVARRGAVKAPPHCAAGRITPGHLPAGMRAGIGDEAPAQQRVASLPVLPGQQALPHGRGAPRGHAVLIDKIQINVVFALCERGARQAGAKRRFVFADVRDGCLTQIRPSLRKDSDIRVSLD